MTELHYEPVFAVEGIEPGILTPIAIDVRQELSREVRCTVDLHCVGTLEPRGLLRKMATIAFAGGAASHPFTGVVTRAIEKATTQEAHQRLRIVVEAPLALLRYSSDSRVFQAKTTQEIIQDVLQRCAIPSDTIEWRLSGSTRKRDVCTQYDETMEAFVARLLEEEGIAWFVETSDAGSKVVFADSAKGFTALADPVPFREGAGLVGGDAIRWIADKRRLRPSKVTVDDHDFTKPTVSRKATVESTSPLAREHYEYPGRYFDPADGKKRAQAIVDGLVAEARGLEVRGHSPSLAVGALVELVETPNGSYDGKWLVVEATHAWVRKDDLATGLETRARLLPSDAPIAPSARTPKPRGVGDLARVTVPAGEEIHCDEHGRIKVQFVWDRWGQQDDTSSHWVRVSQMQTSGSVVIPRRGWEVLVEYEDGDLDRPVVVGRLYNPLTPPTDPLPAGKSNSTLGSFSTPGGGGQNGIRMNDGGGGELIRVHAEKDLNLVVANNKQEKVTTAADVGVGVNHTLKVGANKTAKVGAKDQVNIGGSQKLSVGGSRTKTISGDEKVDVTGSRSVTIGGSHTTMTPMSISTTTSGNLTETVGGICLEGAGLGVALSVAGSASITVGAAKVEAVASGKSDMTLGARASTVGGAFINVSPKDVAFTTKGAKATAVGGAWLANAGGDAELSSSASISIMVGGAFIANAAEIELKVGGSSVSISAGSVVLHASEVKLTGSGLLSELAGQVGSK